MADCHWQCYPLVRFERCRYVLLNALVLVSVTQCYTVLHYVTQCDKGCSMRGKCANRRLQRMLMLRTEHFVMYIPDMEAGDDDVKDV